MRCTKLVKCISIILFLSLMHFEIDAITEEGPEPLDRRNIIQDLWSLLGLKSSNSTSHSEQNPTIDDDSTTITTSNTSSTNNTIINDDNSTIINDNNETYADTNFTSISDNIINNESFSNNNSQIVGNDSSGSNFTQTVLDAINYFTGLKNDTSTNGTTNSTGDVNNINMTTNWSLSELNQNSVNLQNETTNVTLNQQYPTSSNDTLTQQNLNTSNNTLAQQNPISSNDIQQNLPSSSDTQQNLPSSSDTQQNLPSSSDTQQNLPSSSDTQQNLPSSSDTQQNLPSSSDTQQNLPSSNDTLAQQNLTSSTNKTSTDSNSTVIQTEQGYLPQPHPTDGLSTSHCSILPNFTESCLLPPEYVNQNDSLTTFTDIERKLSNLYVQSCLLRYCSPGEWCLGSAMDGLINDSLNLSSKFCSSTFLTCLTTTADKYLSCNSHQQFKTITDSLELICKYKNLMNYQQSLRSCGYHTMKLISVTLSDLKRNIQTTDDFCFSQKGYLMASFNCLLTQCQEVFTIILTGYEPWKWFTENRTKAFRCPSYYECASSSTLLKASSTTYMPYRLDDTTSRTSLNIERTTESNVIDNNAILDGLSNDDQEVKTNEKSPDSQAFGDSVAENSHIMASLSAMMVILMIGMAIMMVVCWRHLKKNSSRKRAGYSKLKTGEC